MNREDIYNNFRRLNSHMDAEAVERGVDRMKEYDARQDKAATEVIEEICDYLSSVDFNTNPQEICSNLQYILRDRWLDDL